MINTVIIYASRHHGNTFKVIKAISEKYNVDLINATCQESADLSKYDLIGFASGIDFGKFYQPIEQFIKENLPNKKNVFFIYTCAKQNNHFTNTVTSIAKEKDAYIVGEFGCKGYNTYGPLKIIGGMNKSHPDEDDIKNALTFYEHIIKKIDLSLN